MYELKLSDFRVGDTVKRNNNTKDRGTVSNISKKYITVNWGMVSQYNFLPKDLINLSFKKPKITTKLQTKLIF